MTQLYGIKLCAKNVTVSYKITQPTGFKITQSNKVLHHICLKNIIKTVL